MLWCGVAWAHKPSDSYLHLSLTDKSVAGRWDIAVRDLDYAIGVDTNNDGNVTWGELKSRRRAIATYAFSHLQLSVNGQTCTVQPGDYLVEHHSDGAYVVLMFSSHCPASVAALHIQYSLFFDVDPQHKGLANISYDGVTSTLIFGDASRYQSLGLENISPWRQFGRFVQNGVWHIWSGFDHILFLLALLLPSVLRRDNGQWRAATARRAVIIDVLKIVTAFTVAHSITLTLAALHVVTLPSRLVESAIAASVVFAALNNVFPILTRWRAQIAFVFGLVHGFGFASVLNDLGLPQGALIRSLIGFNVGVEIGQMAIVAVLLPLAYWIRDKAVYRRVVFHGGSIAIALVAGVWFIERAFEVALFRFR